MYWCERVSPTRVLYCVLSVCVFFQAEDGIRYLVRSRGLGDVYKRQELVLRHARGLELSSRDLDRELQLAKGLEIGTLNICLLYTSDAADERSSVDLGGRRIIKKKKKESNAITD